MLKTTCSLKRFALPILAGLLASPTGLGQQPSNGDGYLFHDSHFHLTNYIQDICLLMNCPAMGLA